MSKRERVHFIAIGGSVMHNLAIALHKKGLAVTGSDDEIFEPSKGRLEKYGLLPETYGWHPEKITMEIDKVILGMHAREDNPELIKAKELGIPVFSFPEYILEASKDKQRIVIAGSHGKTSITSMILHVLNYYNKEFDYLVGAQIDGFETMVGLSDAPIIVIEGDEYLTSPLDKTPKFLKYEHHIGVISGISWDHINVFPTYEEYVEQFRKFVLATPRAGSLVYNTQDKEVKKLLNLQKDNDEVLKFPYKKLKAKIKDGITYVKGENIEVPLQVFGDHNLSNMAAAMIICDRLCIYEDEFLEAIKDFKGASKRLELLAKNEDSAIYKDFAHSPSKLEATCEAVKKQFKDRKLVACLELHTFSSLNKTFIKEYKDTFNSPDEAIVYYNPKTITHKKLEDINEQEVVEAFNNKELKVFTDSEMLEQYLSEKNWKNTNLLMMSSGNFDGIDLSKMSEKLLAH